MFSPRQYQLIDPVRALAVDAICEAQRTCIWGVAEHMDITGAIELLATQTMTIIDSGICPGLVAEE